MNELSDLVHSVSREFIPSIPFGMESYKSVVELMVYILVAILIVSILILRKVNHLVKNQNEIKEDNEKKNDVICN